MQTYIADGRVTFISSKGLTQTAKGTATLTFGFACSSTYKQDDGSMLSTYHTVVSYGKQAEFLSKALSVGSPILVKGQIIDRPYVSEDGEQKGYRFLLPDKLGGITLLETKEDSELRKKKHENEPLIDDNLEEDYSFPNELDEEFPF